MARQHLETMTVTEILRLSPENLIYHLRDETAFDDERGLRFRKTGENLAPAAPRGNGSKRCPVRTVKGKPCPNTRNHGRPACHVHDPQGVFAKQQGAKYRKRMEAALEVLA